MTIKLRRTRFAIGPVCFCQAARAASLVILVLSFCFISNPAKAQKRPTQDQERSISNPVQKPAETPAENPAENGAKPQRRTPLGTQVPAGSGLLTLRASASAEPVSAVLQRTGDAHSSRQLSSTDMVAEGSVTVYTASGPAALHVTLLRSGEQQGQRILLTQAGKVWDGKGDHLTAEGRRALEFLETQYAHGVRQFIESPKRDATIATIIDNGTKGSSHVVTVQEKDGIATRYYLDRATSRMTQFEFIRGQSRDKSGRVIPDIHSYAFSDFRIADGIATPFTPFKVEHSINGVLQEELQLTRVQYNAAARSTAVQR